MICSLQSMEIGILPESHRTKTGGQDDNSSRRAVSTRPSHGKWLYGSPKCEVAPSEVDLPNELREILE